MPKLLYIWEYGGDLGHVSVFIPIAIKLRESGWHVTFAIPEYTANIDAARKLIENYGFDPINTPGSAFDSPRLPIDTHAQMVHSLSGFNDSSALTFILRSWLSIYDTEKPDVVVGDYALGALLAARIMNIATAILDLGFFVPEQHSDLPCFSDTINALRDQHPGEIVTKRNTESKHTNADYEIQVVKTINQSLERIGAPKLKYFKDLYRADKILKLNYPELAAFSHKDESTFMGAVAPVFPHTHRQSNSKWHLDDKNQPRIFAYLKKGTPSILNIMETLRQNDRYESIVYLPGSSKRLIREYSRPHVSLIPHPADMSIILKTADLIICNAGVGMITQSLLAGIPLLMAPAYTEQTLNTLRVVTYGAGLEAFREDTPKDIHRKIHELVFNPRYKHQARTFKATHAPANTALIASQLQQLFHERPKRHSTVKPTVKRHSKRVRFRDFDTIFLSYDEPNAERHWNKLKEIVPNAIRVHGVKGIDAAHKAAAMSSNTERFVVVDADNQVDPAFFEIEADVPIQYEHSIWQWSSRNEISGLTYGFGGVKVWTKELALSMQTHEACGSTDSPLKNDFWRHPSYQSFYPVFSKNYTNGSPYQAFRAGYREGIKISNLLDCSKGIKHLERLANHPDARRIAIWMSTGADVANGYWSMLGARMGFLHSFQNPEHMQDVNAYNRFKKYWTTVFCSLTTHQEQVRSQSGTSHGTVLNQQLIDKVVEQGHVIRNSLNKPAIIDMDSDQSREFKHALLSNVKNTPSLFTPVRGQREV